MVRTEVDRRLTVRAYRSPQRRRADLAGCSILAFPLVMGFAARLLGCPEGSSLWACFVKASGGGDKSSEAGVHTERDDDSRVVVDAPGTPSWLNRLCYVRQNPR